MERAAICHRMDKNDCFALEKGKFLFRVKTKKDDLRQVILHHQDKYLPLSIKDTRAATTMEKVACDGDSDFYECVLTFDVICLRYYFEFVDWNGERIFYSNYEFVTEAPDNNERMFDCPQNLREEEMFEMPEWAKGKVLYQIFPSRFATTKEVPEEIWYRTPMTNEADLRGDLQGIIRALPYMKELGIDVVYMTPVFWGETCHKYDTVDYYTIDPSFGTKEDLKELVQKAHAMGMYVILDAVFNHSSRKFFAFADLLEKGEQSRYRDWYYIEEFPIRAERGQKPTYKSFGYHGYMPKLNLRNPETEAYFIDVAKYWIRECDIDGWRMDVGDEISHRFWKRFREAIKAVKPDVLIIGEIWHHMHAFLEGDEWDTVMNYHFYNGVMDLVAKETIGPSEFVNRLGFLRGNTHTKVYPVLWNLIDSHDTERFLHSCGEKKEKQKLAAALQLFLPGMPMIYYGDEVGMTGGHDPDCRRGMLWKEELQDHDMKAWYRSLIALRKELPQEVSMEAEDEKSLLVLKSGDYTMLLHVGGEPVSVKAEDGAAYDLIRSYMGKQCCLSEKILDGSLAPYEVMVFQKR